MNYLKIAQNVLRSEAQALEEAAVRLTEKQLKDLAGFFEYLNNVGGSLIFCGIGKSGHIAQKLASTFSSLGLASWYLHPTDALHGDLGRVRKNDGIVFISKSGTTEEIIRVLPFIDIERSMIIGLLGNINSKIGEMCGIVFDCSVASEACINNMAPTTSSTLALAMGDALAVVYENMIGLSQEKFAENHPGGILGKVLRYKVRDLMWKLENCPTLSPESKLQDVILAMTKQNIGGCGVVDKNGILQGIIVEGDIRRTFLKSTTGLDTPVAEIMNKNPVSISPDALAYDALKLMEKRK